MHFRNKIEKIRPFNKITALLHLLPNGLIEELYKTSMMLFFYSFSFVLDLYSALHHNCPRTPNELIFSVPVSFGP